MNPAPALKAGVSSSGWQGASASFLLLLGLVQTGNSILSVLLFVAAVLRETPDFWLNSGDYPVLLREAVKWLFYPFGMVCLTMAFVGVRVSWSLMRTGRQGAVVLLVLCGLQLLVLLMVVAVVLWNNIANLLNGVSFHHHEM